MQTPQSRRVSIVEHCNIRDVATVVAVVNLVVQSFVERRDCHDVANHVTRNVMFTLERRNVTTSPRHQPSHSADITSRDPVTHLVFQSNAPCPGKPVHF